jgi:hypothetical protein
MMAQTWRLQSPMLWETHILLVIQPIHYNVFLGQISITSIQYNPGVSHWEIIFRQSLLRDGVFAGQPIIKSMLEDASEVLGTTHSDLNGFQIGALQLGHGLGYRRSALTQGGYSIEAMVQSCKIPSVLELH